MTKSYKIYSNIQVLYFRSVSVEDVTKIERKLMQTMEMIALKKKKIALAQRDKRERARGRGEICQIKENQNERETVSGTIKESTYILRLRLLFY